MKIVLSGLILAALFVGTRLNSKDVRKAIRIVSGIGFAVLIAFSLNNADYSVYERNYNQLQSLSGSAFEIGYSFLSYIFKMAGASYTVFNLILSVAALLMIESTIAKYCRMPEWVMVLYFVYPLTMDATQYRNFLCMAILIFAIRYLVEKKPYWWVKYYIFVLIAVTFHNIAIIAAVIPIIMAFRRYYAIVLPAIVIFGLLFVYSPLFQPTIRWISDNIFHKSYNYFNIRPGLGLLIPIGLQVAMTLMTCYRQSPMKVQRTLLRKAPEIRCERSNYDRFNTVMVPYFQAALVYIVLYAMASHFFRAFRSIYILGYIAIVNNIYTMKKESKTTYIVLLVLMLAVTWFVEIFHLADLVFIPFFT